MAFVMAFSTLKHKAITNQNITWAIFFFEIYIAAVVNPLTPQMF